MNNVKLHNTEFSNCSLFKKFRDTRIAVKCKTFGVTAGGTCINHYNLNG